MTVTLASNEQIVKEWIYASDKNSRIEYTLLVTNKRIVACDSSRKHSHRIEIANENIAGVETEYDKKGVKTGIFVMLAGLAAVVLGIIVHYVMAIVGAVSIIVGIVLACVLKRAQLVVCVFSKSRYENVLCVGVSSLAQNKRIRESKTKIVINRDVAEEIVETLGAIILAK